VKSVGVVVYGSDDGLCGAYNINILKYLIGVIADLKKEYGEELQVRVYSVGGKIAKAVEKLKISGVEARRIEGVDSKMQGAKVNEFTDLLRNAFSDGELDRVEVLYMRFLSISRQRATRAQLLPVTAADLMADADGSVDGNKPYLFEPDPNSIFNQVLPMYISSTMQQITIENRASEQAARIMAMQSANDNAKKLLESLQLEYNKLRQQSITTELLDILGGQVEK
jgi:F-type H+-transporting ATPase subunit gamma